MDMVNMHNHYKELLSELDKCYSGIEQDIHKKYKEFIENWKSRMDKKCKSLKMAYEEEHKLREELRTWAEVNMIALQDKVKELSEDKKKNLEKISVIIAGGEKELDSVKKSVEQEYLNKIEKIKAEKAVIEGELALTATKSKAQSTEIAGLIVEIILQKVESKVTPVPIKPSVPVSSPVPVSVPVQVPPPDLAELKKLKEENSKLKKELIASKSVSPVPANPLMDKNMLSENEDLKKQIEHQNINYQKKLGEIISERDSLKKELSVYTASASMPLDTDNAETQVLRSQVALITAQINEAREKIKTFEGQNAELKTLQNNITQKDAEISSLNAKILEYKPQPINNDQEIYKRDLEIEKLHENVQQLRKQLEEISAVPVGLVSSNPGDDKEKKELKSIINKLEKHNQILKEELEKAESKPNEVNSDEIELLKASLEEARFQISQLKSNPPDTSKKQSDLPIPKKKIPKKKPELIVDGQGPKANIKKLESIESDDSEINETLKPKSKVKKPDPAKSSELDQKLKLANEKIEFLELQLKNSGILIPDFQDSKISELNQEIFKANMKIQSLTEELNSHKGGNPEELINQLEALKNENLVLKSNANDMTSSNKELKSLQEELKQRPTKDDVAKLNEIIAGQEKQLKESNSNQSQLVKSLNDQLAQLKAGHATELKNNENKYSAALKDCNDTISKLNSQISELEKIRQNLEKELKSELNSKSNLKSELEQVKKVAGEAAVLTVKVQEMTAQIANLQEKNLAKEQELKDSIRQRKLLHNQLEDLKGKIRVFCRVRPLSSSEKERGCTNIATIVDEFTIACESKNGIKPFVYDSVFGPNASQEDVFEDTKRVVQSAVDGYNVCVFAYGQTGSGKTFTMQGVPGNPGVTPRAMTELFDVLNHLPSHYKWQVSCYMVEIYLDNLVDLFLPKNFKGTPPALTIKKDVKGIVVIPEATLIIVTNAKEIMEKFDEGNLMRHISSTKMNDTSSRSHLIFGVMIDVTNSETNQRTVGKLSLVDLAGSERVSKTEATAERLKEGRAINKSLSALGDVISALSSNESHIPYRNNKLTMLMSDSLGGTAKTLMFVNISPANYNQEETTMSLYYAARVKLITNDPSKNVESKEMSVLKQEIINVTIERDKYKAVLEKNGLNLAKLEDVAESKQEEFDDAKYDDL